MKRVSAAPLEKRSRAIAKTMKSGSKVQLTTLGIFETNLTEDFQVLAIVTIRFLV
jgi:hypothetical protein